jgi:hypothetical protein
MNPLPQEEHSSLEQCPFCELDTHQNETKLSHIRHELAAHLPFTVAAVIVAFGIIWLLDNLGKMAEFQSAFHIFFPAHVFLSTTTTTAMFWRHDKKMAKALLIGCTIPLISCSLSDIFMPYLGGVIMGQSMQLHICLIEEPELIFPFMALGIICGMVAVNYLRHTTFFSHSAHILVSSLAALLYLISFGMVAWTALLGGLLIIILLSVLIPCCLSDIVFPLLFIHPSVLSSDKQH